MQCLFYLIPRFAHCRIPEGSRLGGILPLGGRYFSVLVLAIIGFHIHAAAQQMVDSGIDFPKNPVDRQWFLNNETHDLHQFHAGQWQVKKHEVRAVAQCHGFVIVKYLSNQTAGLNIIGGEEFALKQHFCGDSIVVLWSNGWSNIYSADRHLLAINQGADCQISRNIQQVQGMRAFCIAPLYERIPGVQINCKEVAAWGILGENGKWLVPAEFDTPFEFHEGVAEVLHYGKKRKINEKGEFLE